VEIAESSLPPESACSCSSDWLTISPSSDSCRRRCFLDLDGFKRVNEEQGHLAGNRVLAAAGGALREIVRPYDLVGRFGGDEFVVVLPETGLGEAQWLADRLRSALCAAASTAAGTRVGVASGEAEWSDGMSTGNLLERRRHAPDREARAPQWERERRSTVRIA
jgi:GGDEF domain-containing protein